MIVCECRVMVGTNADGIVGVAVVLVKAANMQQHFKNNAPDDRLICGSKSMKRQNRMCNSSSATDDVGGDGNEWYDWNHKNYRVYR